MSRIAKYPVPVPKGVDVTLAGGNISVKGPLGVIARAADPNVTVEKDGRVVFATDVMFDLGSWTLTPKGHQILAAFAQTQKSNVMKIVGHTDSKRIASAKLKTALETDTNKELSVKRAIAVMGELLKGGIRESQIASVEGHGSDEPRGSDAKSRRVEIFVLPGAHVAPTSAVKPAKTTKK